MSEQRERNDLAGKPLSFALTWGFPIAILVSMKFLEPFVPYPAVLATIAGTFSWMGFACLVNAFRSGRLHCFFSGPIFLIGAAGVLLVGFEIATFPPIGVDAVIWGTALLALLTFVPERIWGAYGQRRSQ